MNDHRKASIVLALTLFIPAAFSPLQADDSNRLLRYFGSELEDQSGRGNLAVDSSGALYMSGGIAREAPEDNYAVLWKFDTSGKLLWKHERPVGRGDAFTYLQVLVDPLDRIYTLSGWNPLGPNFADAEIQRLTPDGAVLWRTEFPPADMAQVYDRTVRRVAADEEGVIAVQWTGGECDGSPARVSSVVRLNPDGTTAWRTELAPAHLDCVPASDSRNLISIAMPTNYLTARAAVSDGAGGAFVIIGPAANPPSRMVFLHLGANGQLLREVNPIQTPLDVNAIVGDEVLTPLWMIKGEAGTLFVSAYGAGFGSVLIKLNTMGGVEWLSRTCETSCPLVNSWPRYPLVGLDGSIAYLEQQDQFTEEGYVGVSGSLIKVSASGALQSVELIGIQPALPGSSGPTPFYLGGLAQSGNTLWISGAHQNSDREKAKGGLDVFLLRCPAGASGSGKSCPVSLD